MTCYLAPHTGHPNRGGVPGLGPQAGRNRASLCSATPCRNSQRDGTGLLGGLPRAPHGEELRIREMRGWAEWGLSLPDLRASPKPALQPPVARCWGGAGGGFAEGK